jgi:membrane protease subunit (stomatin/prohibitin family)
MGLFNWKNSNESAYVGGQKHWVDVIKNSGDGKLLIWRQPEEDFNTNSTLIVMPGEQAIFINAGNIEQVFTSGTYKLSTENYPFISRLRNVFSGGISTFNSVVYFVREADSHEIEWGTMQPIRYGDPMLGPVNIKAGGAYKIQINNPQKFLTKLIGNNVDFETQNGLNKYFSNEFTMHISNSINKTLQVLQSQNYKEVYHYVGNLIEFAQSVETQLQDILDDYGIRLKAFSISRCKDEYEDPEIQKMITDKKRMQYLGGAWVAQQQVDIMKNISQNDSAAGGLAAAGAGLGMGLNMGGMMGGMMQNTFSPNPLQQQPSPTTNPIMEKLKQLKDMFDMGLISQEDFDKKKQELLSQM